MSLEHLSEDCDCKKLLRVLDDIGEPYGEPFEDRNGDIIIRMSDEFAFIFTAEGVRK